MYNSHLTHQSGIFTSQQINSSVNPEVNEILRRHEEIANNIKKIRSSSQLPPSYTRSTYNIPQGSYSHIGDNDNEAETIITTTTMTITPNALRNSYAPQQPQFTTGLSSSQYQRGNNFLNNNYSNNNNGTNDLVSQLNRANEKILSISQDIRNFNDNISRSQVLNKSGINNNSFYSNNNNPIISPISRRNEDQQYSGSNSYLSVNNNNNNYSNPRSASVYSSRYLQAPPANNQSQVIYPASRGASQKRVTEIITTTYENDVPSYPIANFSKNPYSNPNININNNNNNNLVKSQVYNSQNNIPAGSKNNITSLSRIPDPQEENDYVKRIYIKGDGFEYEEIIDEEDPQNNYKALRDAYHDEWQKIDYIPDFVLPFLEIQKQSNLAASSMSQMNMSQISPINEPVKFDYRQNNHLSGLSSNYLNNSHAETAANITHSYLRDAPTTKSYYV